MTGVALLLLPGHRITLSTRASSCSSGLPALCLQVGQKSAVTGLLVLGKGGGRVKRSANHRSRQSGSSCCAKNVFQPRRNNALTMNCVVNSQTKGFGP